LLLVTLPEYKQTKLCRKELRLLKMLWDTIHIVNSEFKAR